MDDPHYLAKTNDMLRELDTLREQNRIQSNQIGLLRQQYDQLAADHLAAVNSHETKLATMRVARDNALRAADEAKAIVLSAAHASMAALRAINGDSQPPAPIVLQPREAKSASQKLLDDTLAG